MYSSTFSFVDFNSQTNMSVQDKRLTQLAYKILNLLSLRDHGIEREEITAKLSLAQIMRTLERRKRERKTISGIELATMYRMKQRTRIEQEGMKAQIMIVWSKRDQDVSFKSLYLRPTRVHITRAQTNRNRIRLGCTTIR